MSTTFKGTILKAVRPLGRPSTNQKTYNQDQLRTLYFFVTTNSQRVYKAGAEFDGFEEKFALTLRNLYNTEDIFGVLKGYKNNKYGEDYSNLDIPNVVKEVDSFSQLEIGNHPKGRRLHSHTIVKLGIKGGKVMFDRDEYVAYFKEHMPEIKGSIHVRFDYVKDNVGNLFQYAKKTHGFAPVKPINLFTPEDARLMFEKLSLNKK